MKTAVNEERRMSGPLSPAELDAIDAYWRAANDLSVGQIYLRANPLLREPLAPDHVKARLLGHWGTTPGLNFIIMACVVGDGEAEPGPLAAAWHSNKFLNAIRDGAVLPFAFHGYPWLIHRLTYRRTNHKNLHVRGYKEEGATTTPFDMVVRNNLDRFHLAADVIDRVPELPVIAAYRKQAIRDKLIEHRQYITEYGDDLPEIRDWKWGAP